MNKTWEERLLSRGVLPWKNGKLRQINALNGDIKACRARLDKHIMNKKHQTGVERAMASADILYERRVLVQKMEELKGLTA